VDNSQKQALTGIIWDQLTCYRGASGDVVKVLRIQEWLRRGAPNQALRCPQGYTICASPAICYYT